MDDGGWSLTALSVMLLILAIGDLTHILPSEFQRFYTKYWSEFFMLNFSLVIFPLIVSIIQRISNRGSGR